MNGRGMTARFFGPAAIVCFAIAVLAFAGVILRSDVVGRMIFGCVWAALGIVWAGHYVRNRGTRAS